MSKAEYEARFLDALRPAQGVGALANRITASSTPNQDAAVFERIRRIYRKACLKAGAISPPTEIASVHRKVVLTLGALAVEASEARTALHQGDRRRYSRALGGFRHYGRKLQQLGGVLTAMGY